jgi:hypothetical protein
MDNGNVSEFDGWDESGASCSGDESGASGSCTGGDGEFTQIDARMDAGAPGSCAGDDGEFTQVDARQNTGTPGSSTAQASPAQGGCRPAFRPFGHFLPQFLDISHHLVGRPLPDPIMIELVSFPVLVGYTAGLLLTQTP